MKWMIDRLILVAVLVGLWFYPPILEVNVYPVELDEEVETGWEEEEEDHVEA